MEAIDIFSYFLLLLLLLSGVKVVTTSNVIHAAIFLVFTLATTAVLFILLSAEFVALVLILVYIGAVIVLLLAFSLGHVAAGLFAVLAMSLGTAIAIALLAAFSVYFRRTAQRIVQSKHDPSHLVGVIPTILGILGGGLIFIFGFSFFISALTAPAHPFR